MIPTVTKDELTIAYENLASKTGVIYFQYLFGGENLPDSVQKAEAGAPTKE